MRSVNLFAALAASYLTGFAADAYAASGNGPEAQSSGACGSGYHPDAGGYCQPEVAEVNRYCPAGGVYHPAPHGWYCEQVETASPPQPVLRESERQFRPRPYHVARTREVPEVKPQAPPRAHAARPAARRAFAKAKSIDQPRALTANAESADTSLGVARGSAGASGGSGSGSGSGSGGGSGGGGGGGWSDRRLKRDIVRLGASPSGLPIYSFQYVWGGPRYIGVMAQDLLKLRPDAVIFDECGYYRVDYAKIDVEMREELLAA